MVLQIPLAPVVPRSAWVMTVTQIFFLCWKLKIQPVKLIVIAFCKERLSCDRVLKPGPSIELRSTPVST